MIGNFVVYSYPLISFLFSILYIPSCAVLTVSIDRNELPVQKYLSTYICLHKKDVYILHKRIKDANYLILPNQVHIHPESGTFLEDNSYSHYLQKKRLIKADQILKALCD